MKTIDITVKGHKVTVWHGACINCTTQFEHGTSRCGECRFHPDGKDENDFHKSELTKETDWEYGITDPEEIREKLPAWKHIIKHKKSLLPYDVNQLEKLINHYENILLKSKV